MLEQEVEELKKSVDNVAGKVLKVIAPEFPSDKVVAITQLVPEVDNLLTQCIQMRKTPELNKVVGPIQSDLHDVSNALEGAFALVDCRDLLAKQAYFRSSIILNKLRQTPTVSFRGVLIEFGLQDEVKKHTNLMMEKLLSIWRGAVSHVIEKDGHLQMAKIIVQQAQRNLLGNIYFTMIREIKDGEENPPIELSRFIENEIIQHLSHVYTMVTTRITENELILTCSSCSNDVDDVSEKELEMRYEILFGFLKSFLIDPALDTGIDKDAIIDAMSPLVQSCRRNFGDKYFHKPLMHLLLPRLDWWPCEGHSNSNEPVVGEDFQKLFMKKAISIYMDQAKQLADTGFFTPPDDDFHWTENFIQEQYKLVLRTVIVVDTKMGHHVQRLYISISASNYWDIIQNILNSITKQKELEYVRKLGSTLEAVLSFYTQGMVAKYAKFFDKLPFLSVIYHNSVMYLMNNLSEAFTEALKSCSIPAITVLELYNTILHCSDEAKSAVTEQFKKQLHLITDLCNQEYSGPPLSPKIIELLCSVKRRLKLLKTYWHDIAPTPLYHESMGKIVDAVLRAIVENGHVSRYIKLRKCVRVPAYEPQYAKQVHQSLSDLAAIIPAIFKTPDVETHVPFWSRYKAVMDPLNF